MKEYVLGFMFDQSGYNVLLIKKERPDWQKGMWNGIGGSIEIGETPIEAMIREFKEETGILHHNWEDLCVIGDENYRCYCFYTKSKKWGDYKSITDERVEHFSSDALDILGDKLIPNLWWMIHLAKDRLRRFSGNISL